MEKSTDTVYVVPYNKELRSVWDEFVISSRNGTFLFCRDYMDYHFDRFEDHSLFFYKNEMLFAILPGHISKGIFYSHAGLTYGGMLIAPKATSVLLLQAFSALKHHLTELECKQLIYKPIPYIYHKYPSEEDLYALFRMGAQLRERKISSVVDLSAPYKFSTLRTRKLKVATSSALQIVQDENLASFWSILQSVLHNYHQAVPVHTLEEMICLQKLFPKNILLYRVLHGDETLAGCILYLTETVAHAQYIASSEVGRKSGALELLFHYLLSEKDSRRKFFDFGTSVEEGGDYLNEGLIFQKEGLGGRAVIYDTYHLEW